MYGRYSSATPTRAPYIGLALSFAVHLMKVARIGIFYEYVAQKGMVREKIFTDKSGSFIELETLRFIFFNNHLELNLIVARFI